MRHPSVAFALVSLCGAVASCGVDLQDVPGRACDDTHPCREGRSCIDSRCFAPDELDAGFDGGANDAGASDAGPSDAGPRDSGLPDAGGIDAGRQPVWQQKVHGFTSTTVDTACTLDIDPGQGNRVLATIASAADTRDTATANVEQPSRLPGVAYGHLRGRLTLPAPVQLRGPASFLTLAAPNGSAWIRLAFDAQGRLLVQSDAQTLASSAMSETFPRDGGYGAGDYVFDVAWTRGGARQVTVNGVLLANSPIGAGGSTTPPASLRVGIGEYGGDAGTGWAVTLSGWQLADDPAVPLEAVP
ncbi:MAG: hypothetical protein AB1938_14705 [Myxococcota bacterium]